MSGSSVSMPSSIDVSIMLLGDEVEDLRRTVGGGRGSIKQPFTLMKGNKGKRKNKNDEQGKGSSRNMLIQSDQSSKGSDVGSKKRACIVVTARRPSVCVLTES